MTITLEVTPEQQNRLEEAARARGLAPAEYLVSTIDDAPSQPAKSGTEIAEAIRSADIVAIGDLSSHSPVAARQLRNSVWRIGKDR
ncbi:MAG TPA: hypothetical protein VGK19_22895 [Capsulimonadaceae bacterium]|jgi:hypothetical protein